MEFATVCPFSHREHPAHSESTVQAVPATHAEQVAGPENPAFQVQFVKAALPAGELEFDGQALHVELAEAPTAVEYVPAPQSVHVADPVKALYLPASHAVHSVFMSLTASISYQSALPVLSISSRIVRVL
jgi:hypothetical protein